ncbi:MAG: PASTA domain-containing protein [Gaiellaceae bacterium]
MGPRREPPQDGDGVTPDEETTLSGEEWPVAEQYRVKAPRTRPAEPDDAGTIVLQQDDPVRRPPVEDPRTGRFPPNLGPGLLLTLIAVLLIPAGIWLATTLKDDSEASSTTNTTTAPIGSTTGTTDTTAPAATKTVADVTGSTLPEARSRLEQADLRVRFRRVASDRPRGEVLQQTPAPGSRVPPSTIVVLVVSGGPERISVPGVVGLTADEAAEILTDARLQPETRPVESTEPVGTVVSQVPRAGAEVGPDSVVRLEIATPPAQQTITVPDLVGARSSEARSRLRELGLRVTQKPIESPRPKGTVIRQSPAPGTDVREGQTVTLTVSTGPAKVTVPDVVGLEEQAAREELESAGFDVTVVDEPTDNVDEDGVVLDQAPAGGSSRSKGSVVTITIARRS